jgi:ABC-type multidrug transport system fused ATPase/permease subunit
VTRLPATVQRFYAALARLIQPYRWDFCLGLLATAASSGLAVLIPLTFRGAIDSIVRHGPAAPLLLYGLAVILLTIGRGWGEYLAYRRIAGLGQRVAYALRNRLFSHLQALPPAFFDRANTGDIMSRSTSDVEGVRMFITWSLSRCSGVDVSDELAAGPAGFSDVPTPGLCRDAVSTASATALSRSPGAVRPHDDSATGEFGWDQTHPSVPTGADGDLTLPGDQPGIVPA